MDGKTVLGTDGTVQEDDVAQIRKDDTMVSECIPPLPLHLCEQ